MNKLLFISGFRIDLLSTDGVAKKINLEINTFKELGFNVDFLEFNSRKIYLNKSDKKDFIIDEQNKFYKSMDVVYKYFIKNIEMFDEYDIIYLRYEHFSFSMISFFRQIKKRNPRVKIVGELPTYMKKPNPGTPLKSRVSFYIKRFFNNYTNKNIDYLATFSNHDRLFNMQTIKIENFVNLQNIKIRQPNNNDVLDLLALANITSAHGFDRVIEGLNNYYKYDNKRKVFLHIVGDGIYKKDLENLVNKYKLSEYIKFYGVLGGDDLDKVFNISDLGIGSLACFRKGSEKVSELKIREYTARGLPFIYSALEPQIEGKNFAKKVSFDNSPIDINELINFHDSLVIDSNFILEMNSFAKDEFSCIFQMKKIINKIHKE